MWHFCETCLVFHKFGLEECWLFLFSCVLFSWDRCVAWAVPISWTQVTLLPQSRSAGTRGMECFCPGFCCCLFVCLWIASQTRANHPVLGVGSHFMENNTTAEVVTLFLHFVLHTHTPPSWGKWRKGRQQLCGIRLRVDSYCMPIYSVDIY